MTLTRSKKRFYDFLIRDMVLYVELSSRVSSHRNMSRIATVLILLAAAALEAGGDALIRAGLHSNSARARILMFGAAAIILFAYGWTVNAPPWDFGRLLGLYVVFFFVVAQLLSWLIFKQVPSPTILIGGTLIVAGGIVVSLSKT
ncbi:hypothetical protein [Tunturiibacter gelidoferens]|uniref:Small multidrug resistance family-3 protein n=1 Tax=Tunturiibacter lichenicola TaxID=2051959 RepID=A0A7Y9T3R0_9BACT|nr:hypothetical protein [Edaphobacter lichenicola]NYF52602.1 small multidrug resistance family-3 protein [Edaphobacter lichenicola]